MATEYISTETGCQYLQKYKIEDGTSFLYDEGFNDGIETAISCIGSEVPAADVRPVAEISDAVDDAIDFLSSVHTQMPYHVYSALFDLICGICPNCGADMRGANE